MTAVILSQQLLYAVKTREPHYSLTQELSKIGNTELVNELKETNTHKTFLINLYDSFAQILIKEQQPDFSTWRSRMVFFSNRNINVAGNFLSLNDIEHGMLRHSLLWWSLGYLKKVANSNFEKQLRVPLDYRIHFALNCEAASCPAIAFYAPEKLDNQLDDATKLFWEEEVTFDDQRYTVYLSSIFNWYSGDFGGKKGISNLLNGNERIPSIKKVRLHFKPYNWTTLRGNFIE